MAGAALLIVLIPLPENPPPDQVKLPLAWTVPRGVRTRFEPFVQVRSAPPATSTVPAIEKVPEPLIVGVPLTASDATLRFAPEAMETAPGPVSDAPPDVVTVPAAMLSAVPAASVHAPLLLPPSLSASVPDCPY